MDELVNKAKAVLDFIGSLVEAIRAVLNVARVPPYRITLNADQMKINYKAVAASVVLLFLARALQGQRINEPSGSLLVVAIFVGLVIAFKYGADALAHIARKLGLDPTNDSETDASTKWFTLLIAIWTWALLVLVAIGLAEIFGLPDLNLFFGTNFFLPVFASVVALLIVVVESKHKDQADLGGRRTIAFFSVFCIAIVSIATWATVFWR